MKHLLLTTIAAVLLVTVVSPEKMATKVFGIITRASVVGT
jgi:hypothetical protein|tara:strand:- start:141 stop:260 length:120 start_codon:yes stop_codon:yes gene_type:complete